MVPLKREWTPFKDHQDALDHYRRWGLISPTATKLPPVMVVDGSFDFPQPCSVVGYETGFENWAVIQLGDSVHGIHGEYLAELQPQPYQKLLDVDCFTTVLSNYIVVDIETSGLDKHADRIIEIAAARYEYGRLMDKFQTLVNPGVMLTPDTIALTGITQANVDAAPFLEDVAADFLSFIGDLPLIGHNAISFDIPFMSAQLNCDIVNPVIDTLPMARAVYDKLPRHKLDYLKSVFGFNFGASHRAMSDVETTNALLWACLAPNKYESKMWTAHLDSVLSGEKSQQISRSKSRMARNDKQVRTKDIRATQEVDPTHPLFGKSIAFTGELSIPRKDAMQMAVNCGAILKTAVSAKTDYLVVGTQNLNLVGEDRMSDKERNAIQFNRTKKANIEIISENQFIDLINRQAVPEEVQQLDLFTSPSTEEVEPITEEFVYSLLLPALTEVLLSNNAGTQNIKCDQLKSYSSVSYLKYEPFLPVNEQNPTDILAFRICCRGNHHYFGISSTYASHATAEINQRFTKDGRSDGYVNYEFDPTADGIMEFAAFLSSVLDAAICSVQKEFDCCSRYEECSNAKLCIHTHPGMAVSCGYRKILKSGRIFYGPNRNVD